ncbi:hypothetical protein H8N03_10575 [Ramlibacter sp. USB13]|uniref:Uncharacterized protein n=1 Tax=Ramlibacter cellulosilyticus TaxID=2764187 RepID=A0A923MRR3_9BURK|nr:hypothetical protein [Ramlibacter cellulosilyticus]MBC5783389.1 hypothetical protein [Ramlibacter cellulosilyticus]
MPFIALSRFARALLLVLAFLLAAAAAQAQDRKKNFAPGFTARTADSRLLVLPADIELYSMSAGGVIEPRADWTEAAQKHFGAALASQGKLLGGKVTRMALPEAEEFSDVVTLHRAVADAIGLHHRGGLMELATKGDRLDWSLGDAVQPLRERTGADYALFTWIRDSYASSERKIAMAALALLGAISLGGEQEGYASLVDLRTGRVVWFNQLSRMSGDLRDAEPAVETVQTLLKGFPGFQ